MRSLYSLRNVTMDDWIMMNVVDNASSMEENLISNCFNTTDIFNYNFTSFAYPRATEPWTANSIAITSVKAVLYIVNILVSVVGNCAVIVAVYSNPALRSTINLYLVNLAVADVLIALCCMWVHLVNDLTYPMFALGAFMCKFNGFAQMTCLTSSVLTLTAIACDRFMAVMFPLRVRITHCRTSAVIMCVWVIAVIVSLPFMIYRQLYRVQWKDVVEVTCQETWPTYPTFSTATGTCISNAWPKTLYYTLVTIMLFFLPIGVMTIAYVMIVLRLWGTRPPGEKVDSALTTQALAKRKVVKMVVVILMVFVICWMPMQVLILYAQYSHDSKTNGQLPGWYDSVTFVAYFVAYTNSTLNPLLYGGLNQIYRRTLLKVFCRRPSFYMTNDSDHRMSPPTARSRASSFHSLRTGTVRLFRWSSGQAVTTTLHGSSVRSHPSQRTVIRQNVEMAALMPQFANPERRLSKPFK